MFSLCLLYAFLNAVMSSHSRLEIVRADDYVTFNCERRTAQLVSRARAALDAVLEAKVARPAPTSRDRAGLEGAIIHMIVSLLETELEGVQDDYEHGGDHEDD
jgi:hypothetical protein